MGMGGLKSHSKECNDACKVSEIELQYFGEKANLFSDMTIVFWSSYFSSYLYLGKAF